MSSKNFTVSVHATLIFISSFISIKSTIAFLKFLFALIVGIQTQWNVYNVAGVSPSDSPAWTVFNVRVFYSFEVLIPLIIFIVFYIKTFVHIPKTGMRVFLFFMISISALYITISNGIAGILTQQEFFHALNWLYMPYPAMIVVGLIVVLITIKFIFYIKEFFLFFIPGIEYETTYLQYIKVYFKLALLPVFIGLCLLYLPFISKLHTYNHIEIATIVLLVSVGCLDIWRNKGVEYIETTNKLNILTLLVTAVLYIAILVFSHING